MTVGDYNDRKWCLVSSGIIDDHVVMRVSWHRSLNIG